jgi:hypothetical protein
MKTNKKRVEDLENGQSPLKPILILWGDENDDAICRVDDDGPALAWAEAEEKFSEEYQLIAVRYVVEWKK